MSLAVDQNLKFSSNYLLDVVSYIFSISTLAIETYIKGILIKKVNKTDCILVKPYIVISFLNCLSKVRAKLVVEKLSQFSEAREELYKG